MTYAVVVAIATFRRPEAIVAAVGSVTVQTQALNADAAADVSARILVIDNDPDASARAAVASFDGVDYVHEPSPGIAAVRNRAITESRRYDALVFLDDDELATEGWLQTMIAIHRGSGADCVAGRVQTNFPADTDPWVRASGAFVRPIRADGAVLKEAASNNLLLDLRSVERLGLRFDEAFGLTGGSDSMFTRQLTSRGGVIRWAQHALVIEIEEPLRFRRAWVLMRAFRFGNTATRVDIALAHTPSARLGARIASGLRGLTRIVGGCVRALWGVLSASVRHRAHGARTIYRGAGMLAGAFGLAFNEYGRRRKRMGMTN
jgi:succinoglycan biosynthesis protein ExoM